MDWSVVIDGNQEVLKRILAALVAMAGFAALQERPGLTVLPPQGQAVRPGRHGPDGDGRSADARSQTPAPQDRPSPVLTLSRHLHRAILRLLRPAEAAVRRLIVVASRGITVDLPPLKPPKSAPPPLIVREGAGTGIVIHRLSCVPLTERSAARRNTVSLPLLDPMRRLERRRTSFRTSGVPRILFPGITTPFPVAPWQPPSPDDRIDATRLRLRLAALSRALDDLPAHAHRFARWRARRDRALRAGRRHRVSPLRPGRAPGLRRRRARRPAHEVDDVLKDLHHLAVEVLEGLDTS